MARRAQLLAAGGAALGSSANAREARAVLDFIPLDHRNTKAASVGVSEWLGAGGRGVEGSDQGGAHQEQEEEEEGESLEDMLTRRTKEFNISTRERPEDVANWLNFVALQDEFLQVQSRRNVTAITEKKVAILIRALGHNPTSEQLLVTYLETIEDQVEPDKLQHLWEAVVSKHSAKVAIWRAYLLHKKSHFKSFQVASLRAAYVTALKSLSSWRDRAADAREALDMEAAMLAIVEDFCEFERQAGYQEKSFAVVQALMEYNCFCPAALVQDEETARKYFEVFWDGDAPRLGETGSAGFDAWFVAYEQQRQQSHREQEQMLAAAAAAAGSSEIGVYGAVMATAASDDDPPPPYPGPRGQEGSGGGIEGLAFSGAGADAGKDEEDLGANVDEDVTPRVSPRGAEEEETGKQSADEDDEDTGSEQSWEEDEEGVTCEICNDTKAVVSCEQCACVLCGNCSNNIHKQTISKHVVQPLNARTGTGNDFL